jgi:serine/threonine protein kinase
MMFPEKIGRYIIKSELGRGGMATVYRAYDPSFEREVAIKVLPREMRHDLQLRTSFEREIKLVAALEHPSIVPIYEVGDEDGQPYFVMRYMTGGSLAGSIARDKFSLQETARIIEKIALALAHAHKKGIIHRDLKPDNILFDENGNPFISDFGVAKLTEASVSLTGSGAVGTPAYMSPEQAQGTNVDNRSDVYGLGVIIYQMLSGQQPYKADTPTGVVIKHVTEPVPEILSVRPDLPVEVDVLIKTSMAKDRDQRYPSTLELAKALNLIAFGSEGTSILNADGGIRSTLNTFSGRDSRGNMGLVVAGVVVFIAVVGFFLLRNQLSIAERPTSTPTLAAVPPTLTTVPSPKLEQATLEATVQAFAPFCAAGVVIPTPFVRVTNYECILRRPYNAITIPEGATFEVADPQGSCRYEATSNGRTVLSCTGPSFLVYDLKVCVPPIVSNSDLDKCSQGNTFNSADQCCVAAPPQGAGCTIFVVKLGGC